MVKTLHKPLFILFLLSALYLVTRLQNLTSLPVFGDEAIYIRWSQVIRNVETLRFLPMTDGKQPLFMWLTASLVSHVSDPLWAGRFISVMAGWGSLLGLFTLTALVSAKKPAHLNPLRFIVDSISSHYLPGLFAGLIYLILPFTFFFDRLSLADNLLSFFGVWALILSLLLAHFPRLDLALILGGVLGLSWLTKSPAIYFIALSAGTYFFLRLPRLSNPVFPLLSTVLAFSIYNILRLGPQFHMIALRNRDYIHPFSEILKHPLDPLIPHLHDIKTLYLAYLGLPFIILVLIGLFFLLKTRTSVRRPLLVLLVWWLAPLIANAAVARVLTARYILFTLPPLITLSAMAFNSLFQTRLAPVMRLILLVLIPAFLYTNGAYIHRLSFRPFTAQLPQTETGYLQDWTSGWGIHDASLILKQRSNSANVIVGTEGYFGTLPDGLQAYTDGQSRLTVFGVGLEFTSIPEKLLDAKNHGDEVYLLINRSRNRLLPDQINRLELVKSYPKPGQDFLDLYRL